MRLSPRISDVVRTNNVSTAAQTERDRDVVLGVGFDGSRWCAVRGNVVYVVGRLGRPVGRARVRAGDAGEGLDILSRIGCRCK